MEGAVLDILVGWRGGIKASGGASWSLGDSGMWPLYNTINTITAISLMMIQAGMLEYIYTYKHILIDTGFYLFLRRTPILKYAFQTMKQ